MSVNDLTKVTVRFSTASERRFYELFDEWRGSLPKEPGQMGQMIVMGPEQHEPSHGSTVTYKAAAGFVEFLQARNFELESFLV